MTLSFDRRAKLSFASLQTCRRENLLSAFELESQVVECSRLVAKRAKLSFASFRICRRVCLWQVREPEGHDGSAVA